MGYAYGHTVITCRNCKTVTVIDNKTLEVITEHICPECRIRMTDRELSRLKMHLFYLWLQMYDDYCGPMMELFDYDINLHPHCETESQDLETNGNREGESQRESRRETKF